MDGSTITALVCRPGLPTDPLYLHQRCSDLLWHPARSLRATPGHPLGVQRPQPRHPMGSTALSAPTSVVVTAGSSARCPLRYLVAGLGSTPWFLCRLAWSCCHSSWLRSPLIVGNVSAYCVQAKAKTLGPDLRSPCGEGKLLSNFTDLYQ